MLSAKLYALTCLPIAWKKKQEKPLQGAAWWRGSEGCAFHPLWYGGEQVLHRVIHNQQPAILEPIRLQQCITVAIHQAGFKITPALHSVASTYKGVGSYSLPWGSAVFNITSVYRRVMIWSRGAWGSCVICTNIISSNRRYYKFVSNTCKEKWHSCSHWVNCVRVKW